MVGDWMGSQYDVGGRRYDYRLFLDHDGRYERTVRRESDYERRDTGRWFHDEVEGVLRLESDIPDESERTSSSWWVLSVRTCEDLNCIPGAAGGGPGEPEPPSVVLPGPLRPPRLRNWLGAKARRAKRSSRRRLQCRFFMTSPRR